MDKRRSNDITKMPYTQWLEQTLHDLINFKVKGICISAVTEDGEYYVNYHEISMTDKLAIAGLIQQDAMMDTLAANGVIEYEEDEDGEEEE